MTTRTLPFASTVATEQQTHDEHRPLAGLALGIVLAAQLVVVLDFTIVNVALPTLSAELGVSADAAQWVVTAYALTFGGLLVLGGRAADLFGRRRTLTVGLVSFAVASAAGGLAGDMTLLVASRAVQGIAAALIAPASLSILTTSFREGPARNRVLGFYGITASVGFVVGLVAGGVLRRHRRMARRVLRQRPGLLRHRGSRTARPAPDAGKRRQPAPRSARRARW